MQSRSSSVAKWATPERELWVQRPAQLLERDLLVGHGLDHVRAGDEHVAGLLDHEDEVGDGGGVDRAAGARAEDRRDLRHDPGGERVAVEDLGVAAQARHALLDPRPARVVQPDQRRAGPQRQVHHVADLAGVRFRQRAAEDREVLREDVDLPAVDAAGAAHHAVAGDLALLHPEVGAAVGDEHAQLGEAAGVAERGDPLADGEPALGVDLLDLLAPAPVEEAALAVTEVGETLVVGHGAPFTRGPGGPVATVDPHSSESRPGREGRGPASGPGSRPGA